MSVLACVLRSVANMMFPPKPPTPKKKLRVAIVGGGVSGLTCAIALVRKGIDVQVYEGAAKFGEVGAAILLPPNTIPIFEKLGILHTIVFRVLRSEGLWRTLTLPFNKPEWFQFFSGMNDDELICNRPFREKPTDLGLGIQRSDYLDCLVQHVDPNITHFNKRCVFIARSDVPNPDTGLHTHTIHFKDGTTAEADVVLGADGVKSVVRRYIIDPDWKAGSDTYQDKHYSYGNNYCYRAMVPTDKVRAAGVQLPLRPRPMQFIGKDRHIVVAGVKGGTETYVVAFVTDTSKDWGTPGKAHSVEPATEEEMMEDFKGWSPQVRTLLKCIEKPEKWNIHVVYPFVPCYARSTVALVGDSAHAMQPHVGAGASLGLEDGYCLAELLGHPQTTAENVEAVLRAYSDVRKPRVESVWADDVKTGDIFEFRNPRTEKFDFDELKGYFHHVWHHDMDLEFELAVKMLKEQGVF